MLQPAAAAVRPAAPKRELSRVSSSSSMRQREKRASHTELAEKLGFEEGQYQGKNVGALKQWHKMVEKDDSSNFKKQVRGWSKTSKMSKSQKFKNDQMRADDYLFEKTREQAEVFESRLEKITNSQTFEWLTMCLIIGSSVLVGWQTHYMSREVILDIEEGKLGERSGDAVSATPAYFIVLHVLFALLFLLELILRWAAAGLRGFFQVKDWAWNLFDTVIIVVNFFEVMGELIDTRSSFGAITAAARVIRVVRIVRVVRVLRTYPFFRELRMMLYSILGSLRSFFWVMAVFILIIYLFAISLTWCSYQALKQMGEEAFISQEKASNLARYFGTLDRTTLTLFMAVTGGRDWNEFFDTLELTDLGKEQFFLFICFACFAALNVINGVFVESAMRCSKIDREFVIEDEIQKRTKTVRDMFQLFQEMDSDNSGAISITEFEKQLEDERAVAYFNSLNLDVSEARTLFTLMDLDQDGNVDLVEFIVGCQKLKGETRSLDMAILQYEVRWLMHTIATIADDLNCASLGIPFEIAQTPSPTNGGLPSLSLSEPPPEQPNTADELMEVTLV